MKVAVFTVIFAFIIIFLIVPFPQGHILKENAGYIQLKNEYAEYTKMWQKTIPEKYADTIAMYNCNRCGAGDYLAAAYDQFDGEDREEIETIEQYVRECKIKHPPNMESIYKQLVAQRDAEIAHYRGLADDVYTQMLNYKK